MKDVNAEIVAIRNVNNIRSEKLGFSLKLEINKHSNKKLL